MCGLKARQERFLGMNLGRGSRRSKNGGLHPQLTEQENGSSQRLIQIVLR